MILRLKNVPFSATRIKELNSQKNKKRILIVDAHPVLRLGLTHFLNHERDLFVCGEADNERSAVEMTAELQPDCIISDICLNGMNCFELIKNLTESHSNLAILVFSKHDETIYAERALRAGAKGYIMKNEAPRKVIEAVREILKGRVYLSKEMQSRVLQKLINRNSDHSTPEIDKLSDRELQVFQLIGQGHGTRHIAQTLHLSKNTIETYRAHIKRKLNLKNASELWKHAIEWNLF